MVTLGSDCFLTLTPEFGSPPILYFIYTFLYSSLTWTCPAGTPSTLNIFLTAADLGSCLYALSPFSLLCPGKEVTVQYLIYDGDEGL